MNRLPILVEATRGATERAETRHGGAVAVVDGDGALVASVGDVDEDFPLRSTAKPFQLLPYLLDGLQRKHPRGSKQLHADLSVMMASHAGETMHTSRVEGILQAYGITQKALLCGAHWPYSAAARDTLLCSGKSPEALHSNCSGKHAGMLAVCIENDWPMENYVDPGHPLQKRIHDIIATLSRAPSTPLPSSVDGCSLPTHWVSMRGLAQMYASLAHPPSAPAVEGRSIRDELALLYTAGTRHPEMVAGSGLFDTRLMTSFKGRLFAKGGAAGCYALAVAPDNAFPRGLGIAFKVEDGDGSGRVRPVVACELLRQLSIEPEKAPSVESLSELAGAGIVNVRGLNVGMYRPMFELLHA